MFSGIITATGSIKEIIEYGNDRSYEVMTLEMDPRPVVKGDSISINGVCLTVVEKTRDSMLFDVSAETLSCTCFGQYKTGQRVNLERAMQLTDRLDGHIVSGHVDGTGTIIEINEVARSTQYIIDVPEKYCKYICQKGSICIDGVSLTVNDISGKKVSLNIIPYTRGHTIISDYKIGTCVNVEVDLIARYLEKLHSSQ